MKLSYVRECELGKIPLLQLFYLQIDNDLPDDLRFQKREEVRLIVISFHKGNRIGQIQTPPR
jgi:hypothetical protein